ncbi:hypothetical protein RFI_09715 [Reticulomyxa filosa]|uniref:Uncharacterized protein n=1 Tax=Reticulomyxa filosa TaxID=46433 RepID=X6NN69_RETFI|nr:hypothetical protein RFI_09715 [Reticulomyxa filosa]|eukprot:ETO27416.1 hypothetical protein RFI_09715 [Reticulomyxa filosa]
MYVHEYNNIKTQNEEEEDEEEKQSILYIKVFFFFFVARVVYVLYTCACERNGQNRSQKNFLLKNKEKGLDIISWTWMKRSELKTNVLSKAIKLANDEIKKKKTIGEWFKKKIQNLKSKLNKPKKNLKPECIVFIAILRTIASVKRFTAGTLRKNQKRVIFTVKFFFYFVYVPIELLKEKDISKLVKKKKFYICFGESNNFSIEGDTSVIESNYVYKIEFLKTNTMHFCYLQMAFQIYNSLPKETADSEKTDIFENVLLNVAIKATLPDLNILQSKKRILQLNKTFEQTNSTKTNFCGRFTFNIQNLLQVSVVYLLRIYD